MVDFDSLRSKAEGFIEAHEDQIDKGIDTAAGAAGKRFGHQGEIEKAADKLQDLTNDGKQRVRPDEHPHPHRPKKRAHKE